MPVFYICTIELESSEFKLKLIFDRLIYREFQRVSTFLVILGHGVSIMRFFACKEKNFYDRRITNIPWNIRRA